VKLDPIHKRFIVDGTGMSGPSSKGFEICFASPANVGLLDGRERDQFDRVNFDVTLAHTAPTTRFHLGPSPQPERHSDVTRQHVRSKFPAELHTHNLGHCAVDLMHLGQMQHNDQFGGRG